MKSKEQIQEIIKTRNITQLIHFTRKKNIQSILDHGILNIDELKKQNIKYIHVHYVCVILFMCTTTCTSYSL